MAGLWDRVNVGSTVIPTERACEIWCSIVGLLISFVFVFFALRGQDYHRIREALSEFQYWLLLPALVLYFIGVWLRAYRWSVLLRPLADLSANDVMPVTASGIWPTMCCRCGPASSCAPTCSGNGSKCNTASSATIAVERLFDGITMLGFILIAAISVNSTSLELQLWRRRLYPIRRGAHHALPVDARRQLADRIMQIVLGPLLMSLADKVEQMAELLSTGLGVLRRVGIGRGGRSVDFGLDVLMLMYYVIAQGFGPEIHNVMTIGATLLDDRNRQFGQRSCLRLPATSAHSSIG